MKISFIKKRLAESDILFKEGEPLCKYTTWGVGGPAAFLLTARTFDDLTAAFRISMDAGAGLHIIGKGSNLLVSDDGVNGLVVKLAGDFCAVAADRDKVTAGGGTTLKKLSNFASEQCLSGIEFLNDIPGTLGGAVKLNAGAYGRSVSDVLVDAVFFDVESGSINNFVPKFSYRSSNLQDVICLNATLKLQKATRAKIDLEILRLAGLRKVKQPRGRSAGSVFKNPEGLSAAKLLDEAGCKGVSQGGAKVSDKHANFIINNGKSASDILALMQKCVDAVHGLTGVRLEPEVRFLGFKDEELNGFGKQT